MLRAQGMQPTEPYKTLQLQPTAPRDLIDEAYWCLIASANRGRATAATHNRIAELNHAYALLTDDDRRADYEAANRVVTAPPRRRLFGGRAKPTVPARNHYEALCVDHEAIDDVIAVAYRVLSRRAAGRRQPAERQRLDEAYRVLTQRYLRAQYDEQAPPTAPAVPAAPAPTDVAPVELDKDVPGALIEVAPASDTGGAVDLDASSAPAEPRKLIPWRRRLRDASESSAPPAAAKHSKPVRLAPPSDPSPIVLRIAPVRAKDPASVAVSAEANTRIAALNDGSLPAEIRTAPAAEDRAGSPERAAIAELRFVSGPRAGEQLLVQHTLSIATDDVADGAEQARISTYGTKFAFRTAPGVDAAINGDALTLPLVFLDDGDVITIGAHDMRFGLLRESAATAGATSSRSG